jgi:hypothetical protein
MSVGESENRVWRANLTVDFTEPGVDFRETDVGRVGTCVAEVGTTVFLGETTVGIIVTASFRASIWPGRGTVVAAVWAGDLGLDGPCGVRTDL